MLVYPELRVEITRYVDDYQPGIVQCEFTDAAGQRQVIIGKLPMFTCADLGFSSCYPQPGSVQCEILSRQRSDIGEELVCITIGEETVDGRTEFVVLAELVSGDVAALQS
jgi:hypothetical protein